ncbi:MAG: ABC transporter substrate-binding protein [Dehalococcoidia bacterium]
MPQWLGRYKWLWIAVAVMISLFIFAACEDDDKEDGGDTPAAEETPPPADTSPLKIGLLFSYTGALGEFGPVHENAARLAVDEINAAGGVLGRQVDFELIPYVSADAPGQADAGGPALGATGQPIEIVTADDATDPTQGTTEATRLIEVEGVDMILGALGSSVSVAIAESVTGPNSILQISGASSSPALTLADDDDFLFRTPIHDTAQGVVLSNLVREEGFDTVCNMYVNNAYGEALSDAFAQNFEEAGGTVTARVPHEDEQATYASELDTCLADSPDALAAIAYPTSAATFLREAVERGDVENVLFVDGTKAPVMMTELGWANFDGMVGTAPSSLDLPERDRFLAAYEAEYGEVPTVPYGPETYDAVYLAALAAEAAGSTDPTAMRDALRGIANPPGDTIHPGGDGYTQAKGILAGGGDINYEGASGPVDLDENGDVLIGAVETYHVDGAAEAFVTDKVYKVDLTTGELEDITPAE